MYCSGNNVAANAEQGCFCFRCKLLLPGSAGFSPTTLTQSALEFVFFQTGPRSSGRLELGIEVAGLDHISQRVSRTAQPQSTQAQVITGGSGASKHLLGFLEESQRLSKVAEFQQDDAAVKGKHIFRGAYGIAMAPGIQHSLAKVIALGRHAAKLAPEHRKQPQKGCRVPSRQPQQSQR